MAEKQLDKIESKLEKKLEKNRQVAFLKKHGMEPGKEIQLTLEFPIMHSERYSFLPNDFARSALFTARNKTVKRANYEREPLFHLHSGVTVSYTGIELRAYDDELVWQQIMRYQRLIPFGAPIRFTLAQIVDDLGWTRSGQRYNTVKLSISRLKSSEILVHNEKAWGRSPAISLIHDYVATNDGRGLPASYEVRINPNMALLFAGNNFSKHDWAKYRELPPMARRLADYISSHKAPLPLRLEDFAELCGCDPKAKSLRKTASGVAKAVVEAGFANSCIVKGGCIYAHREPIKEVADPAAPEKPRPRARAKKAAVPEGGVDI